VIKNGIARANQGIAKQARELTGILRRKNKNIVDSTKSIIEKHWVDA
jgi:hypothetical protein